MSGSLLDVNALIALLWEAHPHHHRCSEWFANSRDSGWATCPITEAGFVRVLSSPAFAAHSPSVHASIQLLKATKESGTHHSFWADDLPISAISDFAQRRLHGHKQITDAYLLALALRHKGRLVTFDSRMSSLAPEGSPEHDALVILRP